ncbi:MAG: polysaccharide deacetylase family protein, partial [Candidatus Omnitrophica bacterium]|nr:polysaccharide deacetylase family protein [Candidatus Omnitrophota bacterium]
MKILKIFLSIGVVLFMVFVAFLWFQRKPVSVLMYHFVDTKEAARENTLIVSKETFQRQIDWLQSWGYRIYSLNEFAAWVGKNKGKLKRGVVLTFDDGNRDFPERVFPILNREQVPVSVFLIWQNLSKEEMGSMSIDQAKELIK